MDGLAPPSPDENEFKYSQNYVALDGNKIKQVIADAEVAYDLICDALHKESISERNSDKLIEALARCADISLLLGSYRDGAN